MDTLDRIVWVLKHLGLTDTEFLKSVGLNRTLLSDWKSGKSKSYLKMIKQFSEWFGFPASFFLGEQPFTYWEEIWENRDYIWSNALDEAQNNRQLYNFIKEIRAGRSLELIQLIDMLYSQVVIKGDVISLIKKRLFDSDENDDNEILINSNEHEKVIQGINNDWQKYRIQNKPAGSNSSVGHLPSNAHPIGTVVYFPILGHVAAGNGVLAQDDVQGYEFVEASKVQKGENYFWLSVSGDSMAPKIEPGDLVFVRQQTSVDSGDYAVVTIDDEYGVVKKVKYASDWIELHSVNPHYPVRRFDEDEVLRVRVLGKVLEIRRSL